MVTLGKRKKKKKRDKLIPYSNEDVDFYLYNNMDLPYYTDNDEWDVYKVEKLLFDGEKAQLAPRS